MKTVFAITISKDDIIKRGNSFFRVLEAYTFDGMKKISAVNLLDKTKTPFEIPTVSGVDVYTAREAKAVFKKASN